MYIPESFRIVEEPEIEAFLQRYDFATMVSPAPETLIATHVPVVVKRDGPRLVVHGHVAKANTHWKSMDGTIESLVIFHGPHGYVSPRWYANSPAVPTWNYAVVHAYGRPQAREEPAFIEALLVDLLRRYEGSGSDAWRIEDLPADYRSRSEEHTSELQSQSNIVCRLLLEKKYLLQCGSAMPVYRLCYIFQFLFQAL